MTVVLLILHLSFAVDGMLGPARSSWSDNVGLAENKVKTCVVGKSAKRRKSLLTLLAINLNSILLSLLPPLCPTRGRLVPRNHSGSMLA